MSAPTAFVELLHPGERARRYPFADLLFRHQAKRSAAGHATRRTQRQVQTTDDEGKLLLFVEPVRDKQRRYLAIANDADTENAGIGGQQGALLAQRQANQLPVPDISSPR